MIALGVVSLVLACCCGFCIFHYERILRSERKVIQEQKAIVDVQASLLAEERRQFFNAMQEKSALNATVQCRTCINCKRVVHRYRAIADGVICKECDLESKNLR